MSLGFVEKATKIHGDTYDYSLVEYKNMKTKVTIGCKIHGEFKQYPYSHLAGCGCRKCGNMKKSKNKTHTMEWFLQKAIETHGDKFEYSCSVYSGTANPIEIMCKSHEIFKTTPYRHLHGDGGCKLCQYEKSSKRQISTTETFIEKAILKHGSKYDYSKVDYKGNKIDVIIICRIHGGYPQKPSDHLAGCGCPMCKYEKVGLNNSDNKETFIEKAILKHGSKYDYSKVDYKGNKIDVIIICRIHGDFATRPNNHLNGAECSYCKHKKVHPLTCLSLKFPEIIEEWDYEKNGEKRPDMFLPFSSEVVWWTCKIKKHKWESSISNRTNLDRGCPKCAKQFSKMQIEWVNYVAETEKIKIRHALCDDGEFRIPGTLYKADGYCQENNTIYEFHGSIFHGDSRDAKYVADEMIYGRTMKERYSDTQKKKQKIIELGYNYVEMWEYDWRRVIKAVIKIQRIWKYK
jgi:hypothetical protein